MNRQELRLQTAATILSGIWACDNTTKDLHNGRHAASVRDADRLIAEVEKMGAIDDIAARLDVALRRVKELEAMVDSRFTAKERDLAVENERERIIAKLSAWWPAPESADQYIITDFQQPNLFRVPEHVLRSVVDPKPTPSKAIEAYFDNGGASLEVEGGLDLEG